MVSNNNTEFVIDDKQMSKLEQELSKLYSIIEDGKITELFSV